MENPNNILLIRSGALGDVLMTTPLIRALRKKFPKSRIDYLVGKWSAVGVKGNKYLNDIIEIEDKVIYGKNPLIVFKLIELIKKKKV